MNLLWTADRPLSKSEIVTLSPRKSWKERSIHILLNSLLEKGMIQVSGFAPTATNYCRKFSPCCTQEEYVSFVMQIGGHTAKLNAARLFSALHCCGEIDESTLDELLEIIQSIKGEKRSD